MSVENYCYLSFTLVCCVVLQSLAARSILQYSNSFLYYFRYDQYQDD